MDGRLSRQATRRIVSHCGILVAVALGLFAFSAGRFGPRASGADDRATVATKAPVARISLVPRSDRSVARKTDSRLEWPKNSAPSTPRAVAPIGFAASALKIVVKDTDPLAKQPASRLSKPSERLSLPVTSKPVAAEKVTSKQGVSVAIKPALPSSSDRSSRGDSAVVKLQLRAGSRPSEPWPRTASSETGALHFVNRDATNPKVEADSPVAISINSELFDDPTETNILTPEKTRFVLGGPVIKATPFSISEPAGAQSVALDYSFGSSDEDLYDLLRTQDEAASDSAVRRDAAPANNTALVEAAPVAKTTVEKTFAFKAATVGDTHPAEVPSPQSTAVLKADSPEKTPFLDKVSPNSTIAVRPMPAVAAPVLEVASSDSREKLEAALPKTPVVLPIAPPVKIAAKIAARQAKAPKIVDRSVVETLIVKTPIVKTPIAEMSVARAPIARLPVAETPVAELPVAKIPVAREPVAKELVAKRFVKPVIKPLPLPMPSSPMPNQFVTPHEQLPQHRPAMHAVRYRTGTAVREGFSFARRGMYYSARTKFIQSLRTISQALDAQEGSNRRTQALAAGLRALEEVDDFVPSGARLEADLDMANLISAHRTPVLKNVDRGQVSPLSAQQSYFRFAQQQMTLAAGNAPVGSMALYGLARVESALAKQDPRGHRTAGLKATSMHQAALDVHPSNYLAANELGVLLARQGYYDQARRNFEQSVRIKPQPATWRNLATVYQKLRQDGLAASARQQADLVAHVPSGEENTAANQPTTVQWLSPDSFARANRTSAGIPAMPVSATSTPRTSTPKQVHKRQAPPAKSNPFSWLPWKKSSH